MNYNNDEEAIDFFNRLLERLHQAGFDNRSSHISLVYVAPGAQHVERVDNQNFYGDASHKPKKSAKADEQSAAKPFDKDTPLSALFRENFHEELRTVIESWRPYLIGDVPSTDALAISRFEFDFSKMLAMGVYIDLGNLLCKHPLKDDNVRILADYLFLHTNLSDSQPTLYAQLRKYMKR